MESSLFLKFWYYLDMSFSCISSENFCSAWNTATRRKEHSPPYFNTCELIPSNSLTTDDCFWKTSLSYALRGTVLLESPRLLTSLPMISSVLIDVCFSVNLPRDYMINFQFVNDFTMKPLEATRLKISNCWPSVYRKRVLVANSISCLWRRQMEKVVFHKRYRVFRPK